MYRPPPSSTYHANAFPTATHPPTSAPGPQSKPQRQPQSSAGPGNIFSAMRAQQAPPSILPPTGIPETDQSYSRHREELPPNYSRPHESRAMGISNPPSLVPAAPTYPTATTYPTAPYMTSTPAEGLIPKPPMGGGLISRPMAPPSQDMPLRAPHTSEPFQPPPMADHGKSLPPKVGSGYWGGNSGSGQDFQQQGSGSDGYPPPQALLGRNSSGGLFPSHQPDHNIELKTIEHLSLNPSPSFVRTTCQRIPDSPALKHRCHIPIGLVFHPLAQLDDSESLMPTVSFGQGGKVVRCTRCRTYVNCFVQWESNGRRWICNICKYVNETPQHYYAPLSESGKRVDYLERPELSQSYVEFVAPDDYMIRPPQPPTFMFLIDVSYHSTHSGLLEVACTAIRKVITNQLLPGDTMPLIGIITFDSVPHFYNLDSNAAHPQMLVMTDLKDCYLPLPDGILVSVTDCFDKICNLLENLPQMWRDQKQAHSCLGSALKVAYLAMKQIGGRMSVFASSIPTIGEFVINPTRDTKKSSNDVSAAQKDVELLCPANNDYATLASYMSQVQITVDLYMCPPKNHPMDLPTIAPMVKSTGGVLRFYPGFTFSLYNDKLQRDIFDSLTTEQGWEGLMRFRVSKGWTIRNWWGHFTTRKPDLLILPCCRSDQCYAIQLDIQDNTIMERFCYVQCALLYTISDGERRIRVLTYCLPVSTSLTDIATSADVSTIAYILCQMGLDMLVSRPLSDTRSFLQTSCSQILHAVQNDRSCSQMQDLIAKFQALGLYVLGMLKHPVFRESKEVTYDRRTVERLRLSAVSVEHVIKSFCPNMYSLSDIPDATLQAETFTLPPSSSLSSANMYEGGIYIIDNGDTLSLWVSRNVNNNLLRPIFGVSSFENLNPEFIQSLDYDMMHKVGTYVSQLIEFLRKESYKTITVYRQGDNNEYRFFELLIEDKNYAMMLSYAEFMQKIVPRLMYNTTNSAAPVPSIYQASKEFVASTMAGMR